MSTKSYVLVVDDEESGRAPMVTLLEELGVEVRQAENGTEALAHIQKEIPGFVVLDLLMPDMDGFSVLGRLKLDRDKRDIPVVIMSGAELDREKQEELRKLAVAVFRKGDPIYEELENLVRESMGLN